MSDNTREKQTAWRGTFSVKRLFFNILPVAAGALALVSLLLLLLAWLGAFGGTLRELVRGSFLGNPLAILLYIIILSSIGLALASAAVVDRITSRRRTLIDKGMRDLRAGRLNRRDSAKLISADEDFYNRLEEIAQTVSGMEEQTRIYASDCSAAEADRDQLSFNLLAAKASPAMLRRVLDRVRRVAAEGKSEDVVRMSELLSHISGSVLTDARSLVTMSSELALVRDYLSMEEMVSGESIAFRMSIMCNIVDYKLLPNIILPIVSNFVENARKSPRIGKYEISLELSVVRGHMLMILRDNGSGIEDSELHRLRSRIESNAVDLLESDVSFPSIDRRIKLYYGSDCGLKLSSSRLGTVVKLYLPVQTNDTV